MEPEQWQRVEQLYHAALAVEPSRRSAFLEEVVAGDEVLIQEVQSLLAESQGEESFLEAPAIELAVKNLGSTAVPSPDVRPVPATIGRYRVVRLLGEGGMGAVYEAEQDQPRRTVALKIIKPGFATAETLRRFQHESQALGRLQHPGIAQIYEASTADTGFGPQPYFAMELIRGLPLHEYVEQYKLTADDRLALMAKVCDAVDHAHQRGVIHRDLKPGNILVDETGQPKILDFGVARVIESEAQHTRQTDLGQLVGTLAYMSPEQVAGDPVALDLRSDVYALGVILYELLAGKLPYDIGRKPLPEAVAIIREEEPSPLSSIHRTYRGDIDTIVAKAMEKDKARRYASAAALAADIRRYLADEPISARPASATYQLHKFARRHKALVAGTAAVFAVLAAGVVVSAWQAVHARRAEAVAEAVNNFLQYDLLAQASASTQSNSSTKPDPDLKVRTALDRAAARVGGKFDKQPEVEAAIRDTIGQTYTDLALYFEAREQLERALALERRVLGADNPKTLKTMDHLGTVYFRNATGPQAERFAQAEALYSESLRVRRRLLGPDHPDTVTSMEGLAIAYDAQGKYAQAEALHRQTLEIQRSVLGPQHPETLRTMMGLAECYDFQGKHAQAEALASQILEIQRRVSGPEHPMTVSAMNALAYEYWAQGKYLQAEPIYSRVVEIRRRVLGPEHWDTVICMNDLACDYLSQGKYAQAETLSSQVVEIARRAARPAGRGLPTFMSTLADTYSALGKYPQAEGLFSESLEMSRRRFGAEDNLTLTILLEMAFMRQRQGKYALAETYATEALAGRRHAQGSENRDTMAAAAHLALAYLSQGRFTESESLAREAAEFGRKNQPDDWKRFRDQSLLGASLAGQKRFAEAEPLLLEGYKGMTARKDLMAAPDRYHLDRTREWVTQLYQVWGKPDKAGEWKKN